MKKTIDCTGCTHRCVVTVESENGTVTHVTGYGCSTGRDLAAADPAEPTHFLSSRVRIEGERATVAVRSDRPVPKAKLFSCLGEIRRTAVRRPVKKGDVIIRNICGTGVDILSDEEIR